MNEHMKAAMDASGLAVLAGWAMGFLPTIATALTIAVAVIRIIESDTFKNGLTKLGPWFEAVGKVIELVKAALPIWRK